MPLRQLRCGARRQLEEAKKRAAAKGISLAEYCGGRSRSARLRALHRHASGLRPRCRGRPRSRARAPRAQLAPALPIGTLERPGVAAIPSVRFPGAKAPRRVHRPHGWGNETFLQNDPASGSRDGCRSAGSPCKARLWTPPSPGRRDPKQPLRNAVSPQSAAAVPTSRSQRLPARRFVRAAAATHHSTRLEPCDLLAGPRSALSGRLSGASRPTRQSRRGSGAGTVPVRRGRRARAPGRRPRRSRFPACVSATSWRSPRGGRTRTAVWPRVPAARYRAAGR